MESRLLRIRRDDSCSVCGTYLAAGSKVEWNKSVRRVTCLSCVNSRGTPAPQQRPPHMPSSQGHPSVALPRRLQLEVTIEDFQVPEIDIGVPGGSATREHARQLAKQHERIEAQLGKGFRGRRAKARAGEPQHVKSWRLGAIGEVRLAQVLNERLAPNAIVLHDRKAPNTRGNIDHIAIAHSGVWVIDTKRYSGRLEQRNKGDRGQPLYKLYMGGRNQTRLIDSLEWQWRSVVAALHETVNVPVYCALSFVDAQWTRPLRPYLFGQVLVTWPSNLADYISQPGPLSPRDIEAVARLLARKFPASSSI